MIHFIHDLEASALVLLPYLSLGFLVESWAIADEGNTFKNVLFNISHGMIFRALGILVGAGIAAKLAWLTHHVPFAGFIHLSFSDHGKFWLAFPLVMLALALQDFFYYWYHRLQHTSRWLWAVHELHHSEEHVSITTGIRHHHLEVFLVPAFVLFPMGVLFQLPLITVVMAVVVRDAFVYFIHANARISFGPMNRLLCSPQVHRIHHSKLPQHLDKNFAAYFPLWDILFGTYYHPQTGEYPPSGLISGRTVYSLGEAAAMPFVTWAKMLSAGRASDSLNSNSDSHPVSRTVLHVSTEVVVASRSESSHS